MWLLSTDRAELHSFSKIESIAGTYAVISHAVSSDDTSFREIQQLHEQARNATEPFNRGLLSKKIREGLEMANSEGHTYVWIFPCCVDVDNAAELEETFASLYHIHAGASMCYAFLHDVFAIPGGIAVNIRLLRSQWHKSGWTLPALVASKEIIFLSAAWGILGRKSEYTLELKNHHRVRISVLVGDEDPQTLSIAERMAWSSKRSTPLCPAHNAYCLSGLFNVRMKYEHGETEKEAFYKLQVAIMGSTSDLSLCLWGRSGAVSIPAVAENQVATLASPTDGPACPDHLAEESFLLAPLPSAFTVTSLATEFFEKGYVGSVCSFFSMVSTEMLTPTSLLGADTCTPLPIADAAVTYGYHSPCWSPPNIHHSAAQTSARSCSRLRTHARQSIRCGAPELLLYALRGRRTCNLQMHRPGCSSRFGTSTVSLRRQECTMPPCRLELASVGSKRSPAAVEADLLDAGADGSGLGGEMTMVNETDESHRGKNCY